MSVGLAYASVPAIGSALCELGRKHLTKSGVDAPTLVSLICLTQGAIGMALHVLMTGMLPIPSKAFWMPATVSAVGNAVSKTLGTIAYNKGDMSLCAPFSASLPIFQFLVTTFVWGDEARFPMHCILGVFAIAACGFWLSKVGRGRTPDAPLLPAGALYILAQQLIYSFMTKADQAAASAVTPMEHVFWSKLLVGLWAGFGALSMSRGEALARGEASAKENERAPDGAVRRTLQILLQPRLAVVLLAVAGIEGLYMGVYSIALRTISKVYVIAIKIGGYMLFTSIGGWVFLGEAHEGRKLPVIGVAAGVVLMTI